MFRNKIRVARLFGIPLRIDVSWLLVFAWVTWNLAGDHFPSRYPDWSTGLVWAMSVVTSLLFFGSVILHELGHALVARVFGVPVQSITLFIWHI